MLGLRVEQDTGTPGIPPHRQGNQKNKGKTERTLPKPKDGVFNRKNGSGAEKRNIPLPDLPQDEALQPRHGESRVEQQRFGLKP